jgi:hypothetical protein
MSPWSTFGFQNMKYMKTKTQYIFPYFSSS